MQIIIKLYLMKIVILNLILLEQNFLAILKKNPNDIKEFLNKEYYNYASSIVLSKKGN